jgi:hypothetical protein
MTKKREPFDAATARKASLINRLLVQLMDGGAVQSYGADFFRARRYVQKVLWSLSEAEADNLTAADFSGGN